MASTSKLHAAAEQGDVAALQQLLVRGVAIDTRDEHGRSPLMAAAHGDQPAAFRLLLDQGADVDLQDNLLDNPFLYSGAEGLLDILILANQAGANPAITNRYGGVAVIPAAERGHVEVVHYLLTETKVAVNHINNLGWTALLEAIILSDGGPRHQQIVQLLVDHGADVHIADREEVTPLQHAKARGYQEIVTILEAAIGQTTL